MSKGNESEYVLHAKLTSQSSLMSSSWFPVLQIGNRRVLHDAVSGIWNDCSVVMKTNIAIRSPLLRKYLVKLAQRVALISLPPRTPSWRYQV
jgi:hypothetical protein